MAERIFVTGMSALSSSGMTLGDTWQSLMAGQTGIAPITGWDIADWKYPLAGELKDYQPRKMVADRKLLKLISRQDVLGLNAVNQAMDDSQLLAYRDTLTDADTFNDKMGIYVGSPGNKFFQQHDFLPLLKDANGDMKVFAEHLFEQVHPMWLLKILPNNVLAYSGIQYGFKGPNQNITNHAVSGIQALLEACHAIRCGQAERAIVVAYDVGHEPQAVMNYGHLGVLSSRALRPFDKDRDGTILAEGAAAMIIESEASVRQRQAKCHAEILHGAVQSEAKGIFGLDGTGAALEELCRDVLSKAKVSTTDIGMVVAHGNGNIASDMSEASAISDLYGDNTVPVTAFKWSYGHTLSAASLLDGVMTVNALNEKVAPGIAALQQKANDCDSLGVSREHQEINSPLGMLISRGFAGVNSCVVFKACE